MTIHPVAGALGAELRGVDLSRLSDAEFDRIHEALLEHSVIFFRDQDISPAQQVGFAKRFGDIHLHPYIEGMPEHPEIVQVIKTETDTYNFGGGWHTDQMFSERPASLTMLYARELPPAGGDTLYSSMYAAYESLSETMKALLGELRTVNLGDTPNHRSGMSRAQRYQHAKGIKMRANAPQGPAEVIHPLVRTHPDTGRKALYIGGHSHYFEGMSAEESAPIISYLKAHSVRPEFTCRFRWQPGSMAIWDNRCTQHNAINDYQGQRRVMHRITIQGERPV
ncbi:MAG: TauD/TfdA family dioxygenase [Gammaproteobacteria bacterium]|nr:TauD/TfdA family dioxygenase [Gammaproteobacteria bacterium]